MAYKEITKKYKIAKGVAIKTTKQTTKCCCVCGKPLIKGIYHIALADIHKSRSRQGKQYTYQSNNVYIHVGCFPHFAKNTMAKIKEMKIAIKKNALLVGARSI